MDHHRRLRADYFTGHDDQSAVGGAPPTLPGYGPNTRTIMQFRVAPLVGDPDPETPRDHPGEAERPGAGLGDRAQGGVRQVGQLIDVIGSLFSIGPGRGVEVTFRGLTATSINLAPSNANTLAVGIPKLNPGVYQVTVTNFDGQFSTAPGVLTVLGP